jgi:hypothetical protein
MGAWNARATVEAAKINLSRAFARGCVCGRAGASTGSARKTRRSAACVSGVFELCESAPGVVNGRFEPLRGGEGARRRSTARRRGEED